MAFYWTVPLVSLSMTSSSVDTSTQSITAVDISDAMGLSGFINGNTTAPGFQLQVAFTSESTATFVPLTNTSGATPVYLTSVAMNLPIISAKQARIGTSNVTSTSATVVWAKRLLV